MKDVVKLHKYQQFFYFRDLGWDISRLLFRLIKDNQVKEERIVLKLNWDDVMKELDQATYGVQFIIKNTTILDFSELCMHYKAPNEVSRKFFGTPGPVWTFCSQEKWKKTPVPEEKWKRSLKKRSLL